MAAQDCRARTSRCELPGRRESDSPEGRRRCRPPQTATPAPRARDDDARTVRRKRKREASESDLPHMTWTSQLDTPVDERGRRSRGAGPIGHSIVDWKDILRVVPIELEVRSLSAN